jgi:hypothetical protein
MLEIISNKTIEEGFSMEALESYGLAGATVAGGIVVGNILNTLVNKARKTDQDSIMVSGGMAVAGLAGAMLIPNKWAKLASLGIMSYGIVKSAAIGVKEVTAPVDPTAAPGAPGHSAGLAGLLPESIKAKLRGYIPNIGSIDQLIGDEAQMSGTEDFGTLDEIINGTEEVSGSEEQAGIGSVEANLI